MFDELISHLTDFSMLQSSLQAWLDAFSISSAVMMILACFSVCGLVDKVRGNKKGYGDKFDEGFAAMGPLALAVVGIVALSPVLLIVLQPLVTPIYNAIGASPAMFPSLLALDMGGYALATQMAGSDTAIGLYSGLVVASMMGITICFTIPFALTMMPKEDHRLLALGILVGIITLPIGCLAGGFAMQMTSTPLSWSALLLNTLPVIVLAAAVAIGLATNQALMLRIFASFGNAMTALITISPVIAIFQYLTGIELPLFCLMVRPNEALGGIPMEVSLLLVGQIAIVLTGAFPMIHFLNRSLGAPMQRLGDKIGINTEASTGLLTQLASSIPVWGVINTMNDRGKLFNIAFAVSGSFVFGDALAFTGGANPEMVFPVLVGKLTGGILALLLTFALLKAGWIWTEDTSAIPVQ